MYTRHVENENNKTGMKSKTWKSLLNPKHERVY